MHCPSKSQKQDFHPWIPYLFMAALACSPVAYSFQCASFLHPKEFLLALSLIAVLSLNFLRPSSLARGQGLFLPLWLWLGFAFFTGLCCAQVTSYLVEEAIRLAALFLFAVMLCATCLEEKDRRRYKDALILSGALVAMAALLQYWGFFPSLFPIFPHYHQPVYSVFGNQDLLGGYMAALLPLSLAFLLRRRCGRDLARTRVAAYTLAAVLMLMALLVSECRSAWLAFAVSLPCLYFNGRKASFSKQRILVLLLPAAAIILYFFPVVLSRLQETLNATDEGGWIRLWFWDGALRMIWDQPLFGVGLGNYAYWSPEYQARALEGLYGHHHYINQLHTLHAHNELLEYLAESGLALLILFGFMLRRIWHAPGEEWPALIAALLFALMNAAWHAAPHALLGLVLFGFLSQRRVNKDGATAKERTPEARFRTTLGGAQVKAFFFLTVACLLFLAQCYVSWFPGYLLRQAQNDFCEEREEQAHAAYLYLAVTYGWPQYQAAEEAAMLTLDARGARPHHAPRALFYLSQARPGLDTGRYYLLLARTQLFADPESPARQSAARTAYEACLRRWPRCLEAWEYLAEKGAAQ